MDPYRYFPGTVPVILSIPHTGTYVPEAILERFTAEAKQLPDTDWHVEKLYAFAREMGVHVLTATHSRYVADLNRAPDNSSLYPGRFTTGLCPLTLFDGTPIYQKGMELDDDKEIRARTENYWQPYHTKLFSLISELKAKHRKIIVFDAHSIRSEVPTLFSGSLPDLNIGTADGVSADAALAEKLFAVCKQSPYSAVLNGRFKGGYITRHYGNPKDGIHAVQLELAQKNYMEEQSPFAYEPVKAAKLQAVLYDFLGVMTGWVAA